MKTTLEEVVGEVASRVTPNPAERSKVLSVAEEVRKRVEEEAKKIDGEAEVRVEGSIAKDTWLSEEPDVDIFFRLSTAISRETLEVSGLEAAKRAVGEASKRVRFAEHPYLEAEVEGYLVNIVPCYRVEKGAWLSSADRTPFHTQYVKERMDEELKREVRLLKRYMKGVGVYGAEIRIGGFSGYLTELLILQYGSFTTLLDKASRWDSGVVLDPESHYGGRIEEAKHAFDQPLIVVDPVDRRRNVAAAVRADKLNLFIASSRCFLRKPSKKFFYPPPTVPFKAGRLLEEISHRGSTLIFIKLDELRGVPDVIWGQLFRSQRAVQNLLSMHDFTVTRSEVWCDEEAEAVMIFELEDDKLPLGKRRIGPPIGRKEADSFLAKHTGSERTVSGPWVEDGRWVVETARRHLEANGLLLEKLRDGGRGMGVARLVAESVERSKKILVGPQIKDFYSSNRSFAQFLTDYLVGRPKWLER